MLGLDTASSSPSQGVVMALVFVFVLPTGALVSRYYKAVFSAWFKVRTGHIPRLFVGGMGVRLPMHWTNSGPPSPPLAFTPSLSPFPVPPSSLLPSSPSQGHVILMLTGVVLAVIGLALILTHTGGTFTVVSV